MSETSWQLQKPVDAIVFDCDGTLSAIEGINELARTKNVYEQVEALTTEAMDQSGLNPHLYQKRLDLIKPHQNELIDLANKYVEYCVPHAKEVIALLKHLNKFIYIVSAGLNPAVTLFANYLTIPETQVYAVNCQFDAQGHYLDFDHSSPLIHNSGKREIVEKLQLKHHRLIHIGDALNDFVTHDMVTRFIGYGGVYYRSHLAKRCEFYLQTASLSGLLPLSLTKSEYDLLSEKEALLYHIGLKEWRSINPF